MEEVKDQELDAAAEAVEDTPVEETETEETHEEETEEKGTEVEEEVEEVEEPEDNAERSRLGRKVSGLEQQISNLEAQISASKNKEDNVEDDTDGDMPMTLNELKAFMKKDADDKDTRKREYDNDYIREFIALSDKEDEAFAEEVMKEMETNYNSVYSSNGTADAEKNWLKAQATVLKAKTGIKKNPLTGKKPKAPLGVTGPDTVATREYKIPKLDEHAQDLINHTNFTEEDIKEALSDTRIQSSTGDKNMRNV